MTIEIPCVIQVDKKFFVDKKLHYTLNVENALVIYGRHRAKKIALMLMNNGAKHVKVITRKNV